MRKRLIAGNWKLNGNWSLCEQMLWALSGENGFVAQSNTELVICPPAVYLSRLSQMISASGGPSKLGGQDVSADIDGAHTGELSAAMLAECGVQYGIVGHSERRLRFSETDQQVAQKMLRLSEASITPIVCVGEALAQRDAGQALAVIEAQLQPIGEALLANRIAIDSIAIAYEPIWAIGTGRSATPEQAQEVHAHIRSVMEQIEDASGLRIIYGGSVNADNAATLLAMADIDGALIGGAALDPQQFSYIAGL